MSYQCVLPYAGSSLKDDANFRIMTQNVGLRSKCLYEMKSVLKYKICIILLLEKY